MTERNRAPGETRTLQATETADGHLLQLARVFEAPRDRVWAAWTEPDTLRRWWGPETFTVPHCEIDLRPGGRWRTCMREPDGRGPRRPRRGLGQLAQRSGAASGRAIERFCL